MRILTGVTLGAAALAILGGAALWAVLPHINDRQTSGTLSLPGLSAEVRVVRDASGTPYIYADTFQDAVRAQGFVAGQDRLFQLETAKRAATGRLAEVFGAGPDDVVLNLDREARVIGFHRLGRRQADLLARRPRENLQAYVDGLNAYIETRAETHPLEFQLAGFEPEVWSQADMLAILFFAGWSSSANFDAELVAQRLIDGVGADVFEEIAPLTVNPDDADAPRGGGAGGATEAAAGPAARWGGASAPAPAWAQGGWSASGAGGSNNWAMSGDKAGAPAAVVTNDPHLDSRILPGLWHPVGLITPDLRVVGVSAGMLGVVIGRTEHIALGVTNAYADAVDLYVETIDPADPDRYLEGGRSLRFETVVETIRIADETAPNGMREEALTIRFTRRGPVITDHDPGRAAGHVLSLRWATAEYMSPQLGIESLISARSVEEAVAGIQDVRIVSLNFVVGDTEGRIARHASGVAPIRLRGDGMAPFPVTDDVDNWAGPIPPEEMPGEIDPARGWTGTANHMTAPADYPYVYTSYASPDYRYRRMQALFDAPRVTAEDSWAAQYDTLNLFARDLAPILSRALQGADDPDLREMGETLGAWDHHDDQDGVETTLFQETIRQLARLTFEDELGPELTADYLDSWYVWQQRFDAMVQAGESRWFDDTATPQTETLPVLIRRAGAAALDRLTETYGTNRAAWRWGEVHRMRFQGPLRREGLVGRLTGNRDVAMSGSGETLLRALYPFDRPFDPQWSASLRMTADLNDPDKVRAVLPGGAVGRTFHPNLADQTAHWALEEPETYWWFSDEAIAAAARSELVLAPPAP
ncbi:penicillin acylase family protein [Maricaulaceae bacterium MS644]